MASSCNSYGLTSGNRLMTSWNTDDNVNLVVANRDIEKNEELTVDYTKQLHLEQLRGDWI